ncbi:MAG: glycosyl hydrolase [Polyangiaceae bacterium]
MTLQLAKWSLRVFLLSAGLVSSSACGEFDYERMKQAAGGVAGANASGGTTSGGVSGDELDSGGATETGGSGEAPTVEGGAKSTGTASGGRASGGKDTATGGSEVGYGGQPAASGGTTSGGKDTAMGGAEVGAKPIDLKSDAKLKLEAEDATLGGGALVGSSGLASNGKFVDMYATGTLDYALNVEQAGDYALQVNAAVPGPWGRKFNDVYVNGQNAGSFLTDDQQGTSTFYSGQAVWVSLKQGKNTLSLRPSWGWIRLDYLQLSAARVDPPKADSTLVNPNASEGAQRLMSYLADQYGNRLISGQQGIGYVPGIAKLTGREPALVGFDLMDYSPSRVARGARSHEIEDAIAWWQKRHGIVAVCWHWNAPSKLYDDSGREWWRGFYTSATSFDLEAALADTESADYKLLVSDIDAIAEQLQRLEDAGVPVLFRPLHEASGGWFWWGAKGAGPYLELWRLLFDRLTRVHQLDNLIWVWNGQAASFYPGDATVDIIGEDVYAGERNYSPQLARYQQAQAYTHAHKLITLSETGALLDPDNWLTSAAKWSWFMAWSGNEFIVDETWNENSMKQLVYNHDAVITLDELPDLNSYSLPSEH